jgi:hypothetical protein
MNAKWITPFVVILGVALWSEAGAVPVISTAADWTVSVDTLINRNGQTGSVVGVTDLLGVDGVQLSYSQPTGGFGIGTSTLRRTFTTTFNGPSGTHDIVLTADADAFTGFFGNEFQLDYFVNATATNLVPFTAVEPGFSGSFTFTVPLTDGDTWGFRVLAGNYDSTFGVSGTLDVSTTSTVPEPATLILTGTGLAAFSLLRRWRAARGA